MKNSGFWASLCIFVFLASCTPKLATSAKTKDDVSLYRNQYTYEREVLSPSEDVVMMDIQLPYDSTAQQYDITAALDKLLDTAPIKLERWENKKIEGYRIQIYRGRSRIQASQAREKSYEIFPNATPYMIYSAPTYRVRVGDFLAPSECKPFLKVLKKEFPTALVVPDIVNIMIHHIPKFVNDKEKTKDKKETPKNKTEKKEGR